MLFSIKGNLSSPCFVLTAPVLDMAKNARLFARLASGECFRRLRLVDEQDVGHRERKQAEGADECRCRAVVFKGVGNTKIES